METLRYDAYIFIDILRQGAESVCQNQLLGLQ